MVLGQKFLDFLLCKWASNESSTVQHQLRRITLSSLIAIVGLLVLCLLNIQAQAFNIAVLDAVAILAVIAINVGIRFQLSYKVSLLLLTTLYFVFCTTIILLETRPYSGLIWMLLLPVIAITALGRKMGMMYAVVGFLITCGVFFDTSLLRILPDHNDLAFNIRFLLAYTLISLLMHLSEGLRVTLEADLRRKNEHLDRLARTDSLTGLPNRRDILDKIRYEAIRSERMQRTFGIILGDIDSFKSINDQYSHSGGDVVLKAVAKALMEKIRAQDSIAYWNSEESTFRGYSSRYGGEEFLIMLPETDAAGAIRAAEKLRQTILDLQVLLPNQVEPIQITMSFGVAVCQAPWDVDSAIQQADQMLYQAKNRGRNQVQGAIA